MSTARKIVLVKHSNVCGGTKKVNDLFEYTYTSASYETARQRAWRALKRDHPTENPLDWREQSSAAAA